MRIGTGRVPVLGAGHQLAEPPDDGGLGEQFGEKFAQRSDFGAGPGEGELGAAVHDDPLGGSPALYFVRIKQRRLGAPGNDDRQFPAEVFRILQPEIQSRPTEGSGRTRRRRPRTPALPGIATRFAS